jgi:mRNA interferase RelE/StbE
VAGPAVRDLAERLPESVASAAVELITGDLLLRPQQVGGALRGDLAGVWSARRGAYRILYRIDDASHTVTVLVVEHRGSVYRSR